MPIAVTIKETSVVSGHPAGVTGFAGGALPGFGGVTVSETLPFTPRLRASVTCTLTVKVPASVGVGNCCLRHPFLFLHIVSHSLKLSEWARRNGIPYKTAWSWFHQGILPDPAIQLKTGTILVRLNEVPDQQIVALYARVSSHGQKADLERQQGRLVAWATEHGLTVGRVVSEVGSGLNGHRRKLLAILRDPKITAIVVEHRDRLARFGSEYIEAALARTGRHLIVVEQGEAHDDLVPDMVDVLTSFCARLYGKRSARHRAKKALEAARA